MCLGSPGLKEQKDVAWSTGMTADQQEESASVGDSVVFTWSSFHNVYMFADEDAFNACDFAGATELAPADVNTYTFEVTDTGSFYFGCSVGTHCSLGQKLALTVAGMFYMCVNSPAQPAVVL